MFFDPQAHTSRGIAFDTVIEGLRRAQNDANAEHGIDSNLILCFLRDMSAESAADALRQAEPYREWILGVGLDSNEKDNPPVKFRSVFADARAQGYKLTMHCDVDQENSVIHIWQCLNEIGVDRIDHGVNALEDDTLIEEIRQRNLGLTVCPISNAYVTDGTKASAISTMLSKNLLVTINSDDPAYFPGYMNENLLRVQEEIDLNKEEIAQLVRNAFEASWLTDDKRSTYLSQVSTFLETN
jgi:adenosine deaminase